MTATGFSPRPRLRPARRIATAAAAALLAAGLHAAAAEDDAQEITFFRIGTGATGGTYFPVGGLIANIISNPPGSRPCEEGGSCGVPGLIAVAQSTHGSVENVDDLAAGKLEAALCQADVAYWAYTGQWIYAGREPVHELRAIANLYLESIHVVTREDTGIETVADLRGKRVSLGEPDSGTEVGAKVILGGYGLTERDLHAVHVQPGQAADLLASGELDAFILVAGAPVTAISDLAEIMKAKDDMSLAMVPIEGPEAARIRGYYPFFTQTVIPAGTYPGVAATETLSVGAQLVVSARTDEELAYRITKSLWREPTHTLVEAGHARGLEIRQERALDGVAISLHPGARRYYREIGMIK